MEPTDSKRLDLAISALKKCEERSLAGQFALEMMHEIRNPLDLIGNLVHLAGRTDNPEVIRQYLREAEEQILAVYQIAGQGLTLARGDQTARSIALFQLAEAAIRVHHRRAQSKRIHIKRDLGRSEMVTVRAGEIVQVLSNLIGNSLDAIADEGTIALRIRRRGDFLCICISDNGHGISKDNLTRLFQPFFTTKNDEGNGLGLALSKKIIDRHGGSISVRSVLSGFVAVPPSAYAFHFPPPCDGLSIVLARQAQIHVKECNKPRCGLLERSVYITQVRRLFDHLRTSNPQMVNPNNTAAYATREDFQSEKTPRWKINTVQEAHALSRAMQQQSVNWLVFGFMLLFHIAAIAALFCFSWSSLAVAVVLYVVAINIGIGMGYHRLLTHRGYKVPKWLEYALAVCATLSLEGGPLVWVATHRVHHQHTDAPGDPHTPHEGGWWAHAGWVIYGSGATSEPALLAKYAPDLAKDRFHVWLTRFYWVPLTVLALILLAIGGWPWVLWGIFLRVTVGLHATWLVNSATHMWGSKRFSTKDDSRNNWWVALLTGGEGWHNNHHAHPVSARHGLAWYEFDVNYYGIWLLSKVGLAKKVQTVRLPAPTISSQ